MADGSAGGQRGIGALIAVLPRRRIDNDEFGELVGCGSGSWGGRRLSLGGYVTGTAATGEGARRRRALILPILWTYISCVR